MSDQIVIYQSPDGTTGIEVHLEAETVWLTQDQMAELFGRERSVITKHLRNVFREGELDKTAVRAKFAHTAPDGKKYQTQFYNLDAILSVGYRVNSKRGTQFRQWATNVLRDHLVQGFTVNQTRLAERGISEMQQREEKAAHLLYFVIKDHPFVDGNKRIGSFLFLLYNRQEGIPGVINENTLTALALLIAESEPANKDLMIHRSIKSLIVGIGKRWVIFAP